MKHLISLTILTFSLNLHSQSTQKWINYPTVVGILNEYQENTRDFLLVEGKVKNFNIQITAYNVSGECAMVYAAARNGWLNYEPVMYEMLLSMRRAGADAILTYFAKDFAEMVKK